jgi:hypothetical protein
MPYLHLGLVAALPRAHILPQKEYMTAFPSNTGNIPVLQLLTDTLSSGAFTDLLLDN